MRLIIDMQGAQASNRLRGIGRYTLSLSAELARQCEKHEVILALNGLFPATIESIRENFAELIPEENIRTYDIAGPVSSPDRANVGRRKVAELTREAFLARLQPDIVLASSVFEGFMDNSVTSIGMFTTRLPTAVILYDLIPLIHKKTYLANPNLENWYLQKLDHLRRANLLLAISESSAKEARHLLGFPQNQVVNISTACDSHFRPITIESTDRDRLSSLYRLNRPFVMYTGGIDYRKNIEGLIRAYANLPVHVRSGHQLAIVCSIHTNDKEQLRKLVREQHLKDEDVIFTGFVPEYDLLLLYNACKLFVFPSWHEGFGLPALEAMACGRPVIGANTSSLPEVIGNPDALFDPYKESEITAKINQALSEETFLFSLERHGLQQAKNFSWEMTADRAWRAMEQLVESNRNNVCTSHLIPASKRPRLAFLSPLPLERSGISDYSADLLPELSRHYEIDVIVDQDEVVEPWVLANCPIRTVNWFRKNDHLFDRILYQFGNSAFHTHMFDLLPKIPGVVVLHDFYLSGILAYIDVYKINHHMWARALQYGHGWPAVISRYTETCSDVIYKYPCNLNVIQDAYGIIVHSEHSRQLAEKWFGPGIADDWSVIRLLRSPLVKQDRDAVRAEFDLDKDDFVVCCFGSLAPTKLNHRLLEAWLTSFFAKDPRCKLVFVGQNPDNDYGVSITQIINDNATATPIKITGWVSQDTYRAWLSIADICVQLRTFSRGETSAAVLDCMSNRLPTIVNAHGSLAELPTDAVFMLADEFTDAELIQALTTLYRDKACREALGLRAQEVIQFLHQPRKCAQEYFEAIERYYKNTSLKSPSVFKKISDIEYRFTIEDLFNIARSLSRNFPPVSRRRQLLLDISELVKHDAKTGIQRVTRSLLYDFLRNQPEDFAVEPIYANTNELGYRYAKRFTSRLLNITDEWTDDDVVEAFPGDIFIGLDLQLQVIPFQKQFLETWLQRGVKIFFIVYDLLPIQLPHAYPDDPTPGFHRWLSTISQFTGAICISRTVADDLYNYLQIFGPKRERPFRLNWFHLGAEIGATEPSTGPNDHISLEIKKLHSGYNFLMVSTIEPRKCHAQVLSAFEILWSQGITANLIFVGRHGWLMESFIQNIYNHSQNGRRFLWLQNINDKELDLIYKNSTCLIAASEGEGFGLFLVEAARHKLPILARDIPIFREVANNHAQFFPNDNSPIMLAETIKDWLALYNNNLHVRSDLLPWQSWNASSQQLLQAINSENPYKFWQPDGVLRYLGNDTRILTEVGKRHGSKIHTTGHQGFLIYGPYISLDLGQYCLTIHGYAKHWCDHEWLEIVCNQAKDNLLHLKLTGQENSPWQFATTFENTSFINDIEIRVLVGEKSELSVSGFEITCISNKDINSTRN